MTHHRCTRTDRGPHRRRRAAVRRRSATAPSSRCSRSRARRPLDHPEHLPGGLRGADAPPHRAGLGLHGVGRVEVQGVRLREPRRVVPLRAGRTRCTRCSASRTTPRVVPHVRRQPQPRRRRQRRERHRRCRARCRRTTCCAKPRVSRAPTSSSTEPVCRSSHWGPVRRSRMRTARARRSWYAAVERRSCSTVVEAS